MEYNPVRSDCRCPFHHCTHESTRDSLASAITLSVYVDDQRHGHDLDARAIMRHPRELRLDVHSGARDDLAVIADRQPPDIGTVRQAGGQCRSRFVEQLTCESVRRDLAHLPKHLNAMSSDSRSVVPGAGADVILGHL